MSWLIGWEFVDVLCSLTSLGFSKKNRATPKTELCLGVLSKLRLQFPLYLLSPTCISVPSHRKCECFGVSGEHNLYLWIGDLICLVKYGNWRNEWIVRGIDVEEFVCACWNGLYRSHGKYFLYWTCFGNGNWNWDLFFFVLLGRVFRGCLSPCGMEAVSSWNIRKYQPSDRSNWFWSGD